MSNNETMFHVVKNASWNADRTKVSFMITEYVGGCNAEVVRILPRSMFIATRPVVWSSDLKERLDAAIKAIPKEYLWSKAARYAVRRGLSGTLVIPETLTDKDVVPASLYDLSMTNGKSTVRYAIDGTRGHGQFDCLNDVFEYITCKHRRTPADYTITFPMSLLGTAAYEL